MIIKQSCHSIFSVLLLLLLTACGPQIYFTEPQPQGVETLAEIPAKYTGVYVNEENDSLFVLMNSFILTEKEKVKMPLSELNDSFNADIKADNILFTAMGRKYSEKYRLHNDSIFFTYTTYPEIFLGDTFILKSLDKKILVLNLKEEDGWTPYLVKARNNQLALMLIDSDKIEDLKKTITQVETFYKDENPGEVDYYLATPSFNEFKKFIKTRDVLVPTGIFKRVK